MMGLASSPTFNVFFITIYLIMKKRPNSNFWPQFGYILFCAARVHPEVSCLICEIKNF